jgi:hypothetical protein
MHDDIWLEAVCNTMKKSLILEHALGRLEMRALQQHLVTPPLKADVVVVRHPIVAMNPETFRKQQSRKVEADETGRARN